MNGDDLRRLKCACRNLRARALLERGSPDRAQGAAGALHAASRAGGSNAFELLVGRGSISREECRAIQAQLEEDLDSRRLARVSLDLDRVFASATDLSRNHSTTCFTRSLDLLHVAAARVMMCSTFASADDRQLAVAKAIGLKTADIKRRRSSRKKP